MLGLKLIHVTKRGPWLKKTISMSQCKKDVTPLLTQWGYVFLALTHLYENAVSLAFFVSGFYVYHSTFCVPLFP